MPPHGHLFTRKVGPRVLRTVSSAGEGSAAPSVLEGAMVLAWTMGLSH